MQGKGEWGWWKEKKIERQGSCKKLTKERGCIPDHWSSLLSMFL